MPRPCPLRRHACTVPESPPAVVPITTKPPPLPSGHQHGAITMGRCCRQRGAGINAARPPRHASHECIVSVSGHAGTTAHAAPSPPRHTARVGPRRRAGIRVRWATHASLMSPAAVERVVSDDHAALKKAIREVLPEAASGSALTCTCCVRPWATCPARPATTTASKELCWPLRPQRDAGGAAGLGLPGSQNDKASTQNWWIGWSRTSRRPSPSITRHGLATGTGRAPTCSSAWAKRSATTPAWCASSPTPSCAFPGSAAFQAASRRAHKDASVGRVAETAKPIASAMTTFLHSLMDMICTAGCTSAGHGVSSSVRTPGLPLHKARGCGPHDSASTRRAFPLPLPRLERVPMPIPASRPRVALPDDSAPTSQATLQRRSAIA